MTSLKNRRNLYDEHRKDAFANESDDEGERFERASVATTSGRARPAQQRDYESARDRERERERREQEQLKLKDDYKDGDEDLALHKDLEDKEEREEMARRQRIIAEIAVPDDDDDEKRQSKTVVNDAKIFIGNLPFTIVKTDLEALFSPYGRILGVNIRMDRVTNKPKGFAFITYDSTESAIMAISEMSGYHYQGRTLTVGRAEARGQQTSNDETNIWKTVPTSSKSEKQAKEAKKTDKSRATWDHWAGPSGVVVGGAGGANSKKEKKEKDDSDVKKEKNEKKDSKEKKIKKNNEKINKSASDSKEVSIETQPSS